MRGEAHRRRARRHPASSIASSASSASPCWRSVSGCSCRRGTILVPAPRRIARGSPPCRSARTRQPLSATPVGHRGPPCQFQCRTTTPGCHVGSRRARGGRCRSSWLHTLADANRSGSWGGGRSSTGDGTGESRIGESVWRGGNSAIDRASGPARPHGEPLGAPRECGRRAGPDCRASAPPSRASRSRAELPLLQKHGQPRLTHRAERRHRGAIGGGGDVHPFRRQRELADFEFDGRARSSRTAARRCRRRRSFFDVP